ncbi:MAG: NAD-dependent epimerase/dehydratase family protein [Planctomycetota bacterium]
MKALVTGGGGFLGRAIVEALRAEGHEVTAASRRIYPELAALGARSVAMDLGDEAAVAAAVAGHDTVFHAASRTGIWGPRADFWRTNVAGTRHVLAACRRHGVPRLVYTSSPSVCFSGRGHRRVGHDLPYPARFQCVYPATKAAAEELVRQANGRNGLATVALRPHLIIGPRDPHLIPALLDRARRGRLTIVGDGRNEVSLTWIDNAAQAHLDAARTLAPGAPHAGRAYFIAQEDPVELWPWLNSLFARVGVPPVRRRVPKWLGTAAGGLCELAWHVLPLRGDPPLTRFLAAELATDHSYDPSPAKRDFGYRERVTMAEADRRLVEHLRGSTS